MLRQIFRQSAILTLLIFIAAGSTSNINGQYMCLPAGSPVTITGSLVVTDALQTGRVARDGLPSSCAGKTNVLQNSGGVRYDVQTFTNPTGQNACVTVDVDFSGCGVNDIQAVAYSTYNPANPAANIIGDLGFSTFEKGSFSFRVNAGAGFAIVVHEIAPNAGCQNYSYKISYATGCRQPGLDRNNDGRADLGMFTTGGIWKTLDLTSNAATATQWGFGSDVPVTGDYNGDGRTDLTVFRPGSGYWYSLLTPNNGFAANLWGIGTDVPVRGDHDRDGKDDLVVFRPSSGVWYTLRSSTNTFTGYVWGVGTDKPLSGDFDGDRIADYAVYRPNVSGAAYWYLSLSNFNYAFYTPFQWGLPTDIPVPADYDGDAITDIAVYRPSSGYWYAFLSSPNNQSPYLTVLWGIGEDIPQPADYDGDGKADVAVYRPSARTWYVLGSSSGFQFRNFGEPGDKPITVPVY